MTRRFQFSLATLIVAVIAGSCCAGWYADGWVAAVGYAMIAFWTLAIILHVVSVRRGRWELETKRPALFRATRKNQWWTLPLCIVEAGLILAPGLFLTLGGTPLELIGGLGMLGMASLKVFAHVHVWSLLPPR